MGANDTEIVLLRGVMNDSKGFDNDAFYSLYMDEDGKIMASNQYGYSEDGGIHSVHAIEGIFTRYSKPMRRGDDIVLTEEGKKIEKIKYPSVNISDKDVIFFDQRSDSENKVINALYRDKNNTFRFYHDEYDEDKKSKKERKGYDIEAVFYEYDSKKDIFREVSQEKIKSIKRMIPMKIRGTVQNQDTLNSNKQSIEGGAQGGLTFVEMEDGSNKLLVSVPKSHKKGEDIYKFSDPILSADLHVNCREIINKFLPSMEGVDIKSFKNIFDISNSSVYNYIPYDKDGKGGIFKVSNLQNMRMDSAKTIKKLKEIRLNDIQLSVSFINKNKKNSSVNVPIFGDNMLLVDGANNIINIVDRKSKRFTRINGHGDVQSIHDNPLMVDIKGSNTVMTVKQYIKKNKGKIDPKFLMNLGMRGALDFSHIKLAFC